MAMLENCSESTINREIKKIKKKIMRILWHKWGNISLFFYGKM
jgi:hypothetical protein